MILKYLKLLKFALLDKISIKIIKVIAVLIKLSTSSTSYIPSLLLRETHSNTNPFSRVYSSAIDLRRSKTAPRTAPTTAKEKDRPKLAVKSSKKWESEKRARRLRLSRLSLSPLCLSHFFSLSLSFPRLPWRRETLGIWNRVHRPSSICMRAAYGRAFSPANWAVDFSLCPSLSGREKRLARLRTCVYIYGGAETR